MVPAMTTSPQEIGDVLVVDDDLFIRDFIQATLQSEGYGVATAANGQEALQWVRTHQPAVVLLDLSMPVMNGWQFQQQLREQGSPIPVVFMTAGYHAEEEAVRHGAAGHLAKPFELDELLRIVHHFARSRRQPQHRRAESD